MDEFNVKLERLSDAFLPREPLAARRADSLRFEFDSTKSGRRVRDATLHAVTVSNEAEILFECLCHESDSMKTFRYTRIASDIECNGKWYTPENFLFEHLGLSEEQCRTAVQTAYAYTYIRDNFEKLIGEALEDSDPVWTGAEELTFKFRGKKHLLTLKNVYLLDQDDYYLWGYSATMGKSAFIPYAAIEGKIATDAKTYQHARFLDTFLNLGVEDALATLAYTLKDATPIWSGNAYVSFKYGTAEIRLTLKNVFEHEGEYVLWGYEEMMNDYVFLSFNLISGKITTNDKVFLKKTFMKAFLGLPSNP